MVLKQLDPDINTEYIPALDNCKMVAQLYEVLLRFMNTNHTAFEAAALIEFDRKAFHMQIFRNVPQKGVDYKASGMTLVVRSPLMVKEFTHPITAPLSDCIRNGICQESGDPHDDRKIAPALNDLVVTQPKVLHAHGVISIKVIF